ncbi:MAG: LPXTG cell wall anchor domain-containing protein, partial [Clostridiales Family XIII bacterium]|nr:LPXTG cell wall anchor domain-containing protein [Clostridiales Family XIII bacterium]
EVFFTDAMGTGSGKVELVVNRAFGTGENDPGAIVPNTGDESKANLLFVLSFLALCCLLGLLIFIRRRRKEANRSIRFR